MSCKYLGQRTAIANNEQGDSPQVVTIYYCTANRIYPGSEQLDICSSDDVQSDGPCWWWKHNFGVRTDPAFPSEKSSGHEDSVPVTVGTPGIVHP